MGLRAAGHGRGDRDHAGRRGRARALGGGAKPIPPAPTSIGRHSDVASPRGDGLGHSVLAWPAADGRGAPSRDGLQRCGRVPARATATCCSPSRDGAGVRAGGRPRRLARRPRPPSSRPTASLHDTRRSDADRTVRRWTLRDLPANTRSRRSSPSAWTSACASMRDGATVAEPRTPLEVYDVAQWARSTSASSTRLVEARHRAPGARALARVPPVVPGPADRRLQGRALHARARRRHRPQRRNLADPGWLVRVGLYLELLTALGDHRGGQGRPSRS